MRAPGRGAGEDERRGGGGGATKDAEFLDAIGDDRIHGVRVLRRIARHDRVTLEVRLRPEATVDLQPLIRRNLDAQRLGDATGQPSSAKARGAKATSEWPGGHPVAAVVERDPGAATQVDRRAHEYEWIVTGRDRRIRTRERPLARRAPNDGSEEGEREHCAHDADATP